MENILRELKQLFGEHEVYVVGGAVRDHLLGKTPKDIDVVGFVPAEVLFNMGAKFVDPATAKPVFSLVHPVLGRMEIAHPRKEKKVGDRHQDFEIETGSHITLVDDLRRRDFTINSIAMSLDGELIDPFYGQEHLEDGLLVHTSEAFSEDPLRVFRALRFACKGFYMVPALKELLVNVDTSTVPVERVFNEMMKAMGEEIPDLFFHYMVQLGIAKDLFACVHRMREVPAGPEQFHGRESVFTHCSYALNQTAKLTTNAVDRLASFLHDLGKVETPEEEYPSHHGHAERATVTVFLEALTATNETVRVCSTVAKEHMRYHKLLEMRESKQLKLVYNLLMGHAVDAMQYLMCSDDRDSERRNLTQKVLKNCVKTLQCKVKELGLDVTDLRSRPGLVAGHMVLDARIRYLKRLNKEG